MPNKLKRFAAAFAISAGIIFVAFYFLHVNGSRGKYGNQPAFYPSMELCVGAALVGGLLVGAWAAYGEGISLR
jgi:hypothetical protein